MSEYISLEDLRGMDKGELFERWKNAIFPFDSASCITCVTGHQMGGCDVHPDFTSQAKAVLTELSNFRLHENLRAIYSLRLFFKDLYANNPPEIMDPVASVELADVRA